MKPWEVWTWKFRDANEHPAVILATEDRVRLKPRVSFILCSTQRALRKPEIHEVILDEADGILSLTPRFSGVIGAGGGLEPLQRFSQRAGNR